MSNDTREDLKKLPYAAALYSLFRGKVKITPTSYRVTRRGISGSSGSTVREFDTDASPCVLTRRRFHPTRAYFVSWIARIFNLKNSRSRNPYACRFIVLILLFVPSSGPLLIITS